MNGQMSLDEVEENFSFFDEWDDKYAYLIDLGKQIEPLDEAYKTDTYKVKGCVSNVWLVPDVSEESEEKVTFKADSDALIVKGLLMIVLSAYNNKTRAEISNIDIDSFFVRIGLDQHLSPNRRNGFFAMVERIKRV